MSKRVVYLYCDWGTGNTGCQNDNQHTANVSGSFQNFGGSAVSKFVL